MIKVNFFYLIHEFYKRPSMIDQFMNQNKVWCASWNVWDPWNFFFCFVKTARFPWNLVHKKRKVFPVYFSKICAWNVIRTPLLPLIPSVKLLRQEIMFFLCSLCYNEWEHFETWNSLFNVMVFVFPNFLGLEFSYTVWFFLIFFFIKIKSWQCNLYLYY